MLQRFYLTYCQLLWHYCKSSDSRKLERVQERALRAVYRSNTDTYEELLNRAKLPTLHNRRLQDVATLMYKVKHGLAPSNVADLFNYKNSSYSLRNSDFDIPRFTTVCYGKHSIRYLGPTLWSKLSSSVRASPSLDSFKNKIKKHNLSSIINNNTNCCSLCSH